MGDQVEEPAKDPEDRADPRQVVRRMREEYWASTTDVPDLEIPVPTRPALRLVLEDTAYFLGLERCQHVMRVPRVIRAPGTTGLVEGALAYRGEIFPVVDLRAMLGHAPAAPGRKSRVVLLQADGGTAAVIVDRVDSVREVEATDDPAPGELTRSLLHPEGGTLLSATEILARALASIERT